jgi:hypothetical protein
LGTGADEEIIAMLDGTWTGGVLNSMEAHHEYQQARHRAIAKSQDPRVIEQLRAEKRLMKQQRHEERLRQKKERDRICLRSRVQ